MHHHKLASKKLSRVRDQRRALLKGLANSLVLQESITTTKPKAKAVQPYVERLVTKGKLGGLHRQRQVRAVLSEDATKKVFDDLAKRFASRKGGYTSIKAAGSRRGDNAELATISFTEKATESEKAAPRKLAKTKLPIKSKQKEIASAKA